MADLLLQTLDRSGEHRLREEEVGGCLIDGTGFGNLQYIFDLDKCDKKSSFRTIVL